MSVRSAVKAVFTLLVRSRSRAFAVLPLPGLAARPPSGPQATAPHPPAPGPSSGALEAAARRVHTAGFLV